MQHRRKLAAACRSFALALLLSGFLPAQTPAEYHLRADKALQTFLLRFWSQRENYLRADQPPAGRLTGYWTFAQGFDALLDGAERTRGEAYLGLIETFYGAQDERGWTAGYYDDESWMALALIRAYDLTGERKYLATAEDLFLDIQRGWDTGCCGTRPGGIWWDKAHTQKATASNAGPVIVGARLAERLQNPADLVFAEKVYAYWRANMVNPSTFQVTDHLNPDGTKVFWEFTYNEGLMIGAACELHRATGEDRYLRDAEGIARFLLSSETTPSQYGKVLDDGTNASCTGDCRAFKGPAYRYLTLLYALTGNADCYGALKGSADAIWNLARHPVEGLFSVSWTGPPLTAFSEEQVSAAVMALNLFAGIQGPYQSSIPSNQFEAENATIRGLGLEAKYGSFTGWGYVAGWGSDGQEVDFPVRAPAKGPYQVTFRYAAGAGDAYRYVAINGTTASERMAFPATGLWESYSTASFSAELPAGPSRIAVVLSEAKGSSNYLNLDNVRLRPLATFFRRGDANGDGGQDLSDAVLVLSYLFLGEPGKLACEKADDANDDGTIDLSDAVLVLGALFLGGAPPPEPSAACGADPTPDALNCSSHPPCN